MSKAEKLIEKAIGVCKDTKWKTRQDYRAANSESEVQIMKSILISIRPQHVANILSGLKTIEVRKRFPKDYVGWVYIYCTKEKPNLWLPYEYDCFELDEASQPYLSDKPIVDIDTKMNGKVVARFWCDKVKSIWKTTTNIWTYGGDLEPNFYKESCLNDIELDRYFKPAKTGFDKIYGKTIHITNLVIFDKPKDISEFKVRRNDCPFPCEICDVRYCKLTRAFQSWGYIEV